jgi:hypothetical protein
MEIMSSHVLRSTVLNNLMLVSCMVQFLGYGTGGKLMYKLEKKSYVNCQCCMETNVLYADIRGCNTLPAACIQGVTGGTD